MKAPVFSPDWTPEVQRLYEHDMREIWDPAIARHIYNQYHAQLELYMAQLDHASPLQILDVGCAQATLALKLAEKGHRVTAIDLRQEFIDYARTRHTSGDITFVVGDALEFDSSQKFDVIFANQIIEHLVYPEQFLRGLGALLCDAGRLIVTTPNHGYLKNPHPTFTELGNPDDWQDRQYTADGDGHFFAYTDHELKAIATSSGFSQVSIRPFETPWASGHMKFRFLHGLLPWGVLNALDRTTREIPLVGGKLSHQLMLKISGFDAEGAPS